MLADINVLGEKISSDYGLQLLLYPNTIYEQEEVMFFG